MLRDSLLPAPSGPLHLNHWLLPSGFLLIDEANHGLLMTEQFEVIVETAYFTDFLRSNVLDIDPANSLEDLSDVFTAIDFGMRSNVYHMLILSLSKYAFMEAALPPSVTFVVPSPDLPRTLQCYREALWAYRGRGLRRLKPGLYRVKNAHYARVEGDNPALIGLFPEVTAALGAVYGAGAEGSHDGGRRIFISRQKSRDPRLSRQEALALPAVLDRYAVETVQLEDLDFRAQVELFRSAALIVGPHGAGLSFVAFARPNALLVELNGQLYGETHRRPWFALLTLANRRQYVEIVEREGLGRAEQLAAVLRQRFGAEL